MATDHSSDEILLNALVDGELAPAEQAKAAARLANDREFARAYATLSKLKASIAETAKDGSARPLAIGLPRVRRNRLPYAVAAGMAAVAILGSAAVLLTPPLERPASQISVPTASTIPVTFAGDPVIPDLTSAGLQLVRTVVSASSGTQYLVATYLGPRGCRLELWVSSAPSPLGTPEGSDRRTWRVGGLSYQLIAFGMPAERFEKVSGAAEQATRATVLPEEADQRLIEARVSTAPCLT
jgi:hypothetical protein